METVRMIGGIVVAILAFGLLVFIHELGHFVAAKRAGVRVNDFAVGMGPALFKFTRGETTYALRAIPFGGYVAMEGEDEESEDNRSFQKAPLYRRAIIMLAGATMNLLLGLVIITVLMSLRPLYATNQIDAFHEGATSNVWLQEGDTIVGIDGRKVNSYSDMVFRLMRAKSDTMDIRVLRGEEEVLIPQVEFDLAAIKMGAIDFYVVPEKRTVGSAIRNSWQTTVLINKQVWSGLVDIVTGNVGLDQLSGPVGITKEIGSVSARGEWSTVFMFIAMISINLGIFNLLPFPALDGGRLLFLLIEAIRKKPLNPKIELYINGAGMVLLLGLMLVITFKDVVQLLFGGVS